MGAAIFLKKEYYLAKIKHNYFSSEEDFNLDFAKTPELSDQKPNNNIGSF